MAAISEGAGSAQSLPPNADAGDDYTSGVPVEDEGSPVQIGPPDAPTTGVPVEDEGSPQATAQQMADAAGSPFAAGNVPTEPGA